MVVAKVCSENEFTDKYLNILNKNNVIENKTN